jgi:L-alanine-DL-glutamate epimerase-like enolase superfamily enzyme
MWPEACRATEKLIEGMSELVVGCDAMDCVEVWRRLQEHTWWYGYEGGLASFAISAIDIALWDLKGKLLGQPVVRLLGGAHWDRLPVIASTHAFLPRLEEEAERHGHYVRAQGYQGVKVGFGKRGQARLGYTADRDLEFMRLLREAVGPEAHIMIDRGQSLVWDVEHAIRLTNALSDYGLKWIEEPFEPHEFENFRKFRQHVKAHVATGEREWTEEGYRRVISSGIADVLGCDPGRCGGITGALRVIELVEGAHLWFNAHAWSSAIGTAASLALSATTPRCLVFELKPIENPMQHELVDTPFAHKGGWINVPTSPGLGIEVNERVVRKFEF